MIYYNINLYGLYCFYRLAIM